MSCPDDQPEQANAAKGGETSLTPHLLNRRTILKSVLGVGLSLQFIDLAVGATEDLRRARPQNGDFLVFARGDRQGRVITLQDLSLGGPPAVAYPLDPGTQTVRDGSRLNQVLLIRLPLEELTEQTREVTA